MLTNEFKIEELRMNNDFQGSKRYFSGFLAIFAIFLVTIGNSNFANAQSLKDKFSVSDEASQITVDHSKWDTLLKKFVSPDQNNLNRVQYAKFKAEGKEDLKAYIKSLEKVDVTKLNKDEQFAFWVNLYNSVTIDVILQHYPTTSIRNISFSIIPYSGPWSKKFTKVNNTELSLDDIEHKILRVIWKDPRVHYGVNCASIGCPNLANAAYTGANLNEMLEAGAKAYVNSPRGVKISGKNVVASKIYSWFKKDFGTSEENILAHIRQYASADLAKKLEGVKDIYSYEYDWNLNDIVK